MRDKRLLAATIGAPFGVHGEVHVICHLEEPLGFARYGPLHDENGQILRVQSARMVNSRPVARFEGINDRDGASRLTGKKLHVDRSSLPEIEDEDEFYLADLQGLEVVDRNGARIGVISQVADHGAGAVMEITFDNGNREDYAFTRANFPAVDLEKGQIEFSTPGE